MILDSSDAFYKYKKEMLCPKFNRTGGIEGFLWVEESFCKIARKFKWTGNGLKLFDNFNIVV